METEFNLPSTLENKYKGKTTFELTFDQFAYQPEMIEVKYIYNLNQDQFNYLLELIFKQSGVIAPGDKLFSSLMRLYYDADDIYALIQDYFDYKASDELKKELKRHVHDEAFVEFKDAFEFWVDEEDREEYFKKEEFSD